MRPEAALLVLLLGARPALAIEPGEALADPAQEARARAISREIRCLVCQNENIDESGADLARDLRGPWCASAWPPATATRRCATIWWRAMAISVLLRPPLKPKTYLLWFAPPAILLLAASGLLIHYSRRRTAGGLPPLRRGRAPGPGQRARGTAGRRAAMSGLCSGSSPRR